MDRLWSALVPNRPQNAILIPVSQPEMAHEVNMTFEELGSNKSAVVAYSLRHGRPSWDFMKQFRSLEEIQQRGRWRSSSSVSRCQAASKLLRAMQLVELRQAEFGRHCEDNLERLLAASMGERCFPGLAIDASSKLGTLRCVLLKSGVLGMEWNGQKGSAGKTNE